jgi:hypothetical protein
LYRFQGTKNKEYDTPPTPIQWLSISFSWEASAVNKFVPFQASQIKSCSGAITSIRFVLPIEANKINFVQLCQDYFPNFLTKT